MQNAMTSALEYISQVEAKGASIRHWRDQAGGLHRSFQLYRAIGGLGFQLDLFS
jgi:hypothetical protein